MMSSQVGRWVVVVALGACSSAAPLPEPTASIGTSAAQERPSRIGASAADATAFEIHDVTAFEIHTPEQETVRIARRGDGFVIEAPVAEPASTRLALLALQRLRTMALTRVVTDDPARHHELRVDSTRVVVHAGDVVVLDVFMAPYHNEHTKVRLANSDTVFAVAQALSFPFLRPIQYWKKREIVELDVAALSEVTLYRDSPIRLVRGATGWTCEEGCDSPPGSRLDHVRIEEVVRDAAQIVAVDVVSPSDAQGLSFDSFQVRIRSGTEVIEVDFTRSRHDGSHYARRRGEEAVYLVTADVTRRLMLTHPCCSGHVAALPLLESPPDRFRGADMLEAVLSAGSAQ